MPRLVSTGIASAAVALALTAGIATPAKAMSFSEYDASAAPVGSRADAGSLFSGRLLANENRKREQAEALRDLRQGDPLPNPFTRFPAATDQRPISLTLPF